MRLAPLALLLAAACAADPITLGADAARDPDSGAPADAAPRDATPRADAAVADADALDADPQPLDATTPDARIGDAEVDAGLPCREPTVPAAAVCGAAVCGNGARDTCQICDPRVAPPDDAGPRCLTEQEDCDQADLSGNSCELRGWSWGQLGCTNRCRFDEGSCASCDQTLARACDEGALDGRDNTSFDLAATSTAIAVAWATMGDTVRGGVPTVHVAILAPDLTVRERRACFSENGIRASITDVPGGWLLASGDLAGDVRVQRLDADGLPSAPPRTIAGAREPKLIASRTGARALLYVSAANRVVVELLDAAGNTVVRTPELGASVVDAVAISGAGNAQRWFIAARTEAGTTVIVLDPQLQRLGTATLGDSTEYPMVSAGPTGALVSYADFGGPGEMRARFLDDDGGSAGGPHLLGGIPDVFNPSPTLFDGSTGTVLLGGYTGLTGGARSLTLATVTARGGASAARTPIARAPIMRDARIVQVGREAIIGWRVEQGPGAGRIAIARAPL